ncbi:hypothetical protein D8B26_001646 [Coccidioides posadasii str. Silveira]|uniref:Rho guanyl nucleotide exchange factor n=1 Tax=Coccidioides posadasii (strain RMSCC 757 / Silveira) TaxID=443226 RepID=E9CVX1_COCPS|nr:rho guanyl nucleotide exchange factor [Coccidioides posadasii str. Silveira]QVM06940.1 hypothetical protein D8B26_001646 [Coccidioides posadasii str. Silveira]
MEPVISPGHVMAEDNIINRRGGESLYQSCAHLKKRLAEVPGFEPHLAEMEALDKTQEISDPVASVWRCLQNGYPLMTIFNATQPAEPLTLDESKVQEHRRPKAAAFKFLQACLQDLEFPQQECFLITDLYGENTTGFVKVIKMVNRVLDILEMQGQLYKPSPTNSGPVEQQRTKLTRREHILKEMLETERDYVHHLQNLQALKKELEETGALNGDSSHQIFLNLNNLLDFAQRFLIRMEQHNALPEESQNWGELFINHQEGFRQYEPFIANQLRCDAVCLREWDKIHAAPRSLDLQQMVAQLSTLNGFFVKPFQRLTKYPLMLMELKKQTDREDLSADITTAIDIIQLVLDRANSAIDKEHLAAAVQDLTNRVDDWKALRVEAFGELLRFGTFIVIKGDAGKDSEREYHIYLFQRILLCCKDINPNKQKSKLMGKDKPNPNTQKGKARLQLKGRIYMANVTEILSLQRPGSYKIQIFWKGDPGVVDNFSIRYRDEETMRKWYKDIDAQRALQVEERNTSRSGTSETEFTYLKNAKMQNPYAEEYNADEDLAPAVSELSMSRNASSTSLRARSGTGGSGGSGPPVSRPPRFPMPEPPLSLHTQFSPGALSPGERLAGSYFSPVAEIPSSTRSSSSTTFSYSRQGTPSSQWNEDSNRYTAPAMPRAGSRDGPTSSPYYSNPPRVTQRPSLPPLSSQTPQNPAQSRMRSASSPDIHNHNLPDSARRHLNGHTMQTVDNVPVPPIPANIANMRTPVNRSQSSSPGTMPPPQSLRPGFTEPQYAQGRETLRSQPSLTSNPSSLSLNQEVENIMPAQLKAKVNFNDNYVTLVIASNILYRSLTDRVDAKLARFTTRSIGAKSARLRYRDEDGDFVTIDSDEAVQLAIMEWREQHQNMLANGQVGEIQLFCQPVEN